MNKAKNQRESGSKQSHCIIFLKDTVYTFYFSILVDNSGNEHEIFLILYHKATAALNAKLVC
jgi:hypothetical protein